MLNSKTLVRQAADGAALLQVLFFVCLSLAPGMANEVEPPVFSVCKFVDKAATLNSQVVRVRGVVTTLSSKEGFILDLMVDPLCMRPGGEETRVQVSWPDSHFLQNPPAGYKVDKQSFIEAERVVRRAQEKGKSVDHLIATIEGIAYPSQTDDSATPGHHTQVDAYIVIQAVRNVKLVRSKK